MKSADTRKAKDHEGRITLVNLPAGPHSSKLVQKGSEPAYSAGPGDLQRVVLALSRHKAVNQEVDVLDACSLLDLLESLQATAGG